MTSKKQVRNYLVSACFLDEQGTNLQDDDDLLLILNSLQLLRMVMEIELMFSITIDNSEMSPENLGTVSRIAEFVEDKQS